MNDIHMIHAIDKCAFIRLINLKKLLGHDSKHILNFQLRIIIPMHAVQEYFRKRTIPNFNSGNKADNIYYKWTIVSLSSTIELETQDSAFFSNLLR